MTVTVYLDRRERCWAVVLKRGSTVERATWPPTPDGERAARAWAAEFDLASHGRDTRSRHSR